jgi:hypothetical protein
LEHLRNKLPETSDYEIIECIEHHKIQIVNKQRAHSAAKDLKRKCRLLESEGLQDIDHLHEEFNFRLRTNTGCIKNELKRKALKLQLKTSIKNKIQPNIRSRLASPN